MASKFLAFLRRCQSHLAAGVEALNCRASLSRAQKSWLFIRETVNAVIRHQTFTLAAALAFKTLLSVVPLLLIGLAVAMTMGTENGVSYADAFLNSIEEHLPHAEALQPLFDLLRDLAKRPREIAGIGFLMLFCTAYSLLASIDWCVNYIWQVEVRRPLLNRLVSYFLLIIIVPVLMSLSVAVNSQITALVDTVAAQVENVKASLLSSGSLDRTAAETGSLASYARTALSTLITCAALTVLIKLMPNTRVKLRAAIFGGLAGGLLIEITRYGFGLYTANAAANLTRLYGSTMLFIPLTLLWLWITWAFVLLGAEVAFTAQNYHTLALRAKINREGLRQRVYIALRLLARIARGFINGEKPVPMLETAAEELQVPELYVSAVADELCRHGLLRETGGENEDCYLPGKDIGEMTVLDVARALQRDELSTLPRPEDAAAARLQAAFAAVKTARETELGKISIKELAEQITDQN